MKTCDDCKHSGVQVNGSKEINKVCRRHPPKVQLVPFPTRDGVQIQSVTAWPSISDSDWCGEYAGRLAS